MAPLSYLDHLAQQLHQQYGASLQEKTLVFPSGRAAHTFTKALAALQKQVQWAPKTITLSVLMYELCPYTVPSTLTLLRELHTIANPLQTKPRPFDQAIPWLTTLLHDFDTIDRYLLPAQEIFALPEDLGARGLSEEQKKDLQTFWQQVDKTKPRDAAFLSQWGNFYLVYQQYTAALKAKNLAYLGMHYRLVYEHLQTHRPVKGPGHIIGIGLHVLPPSVQKIFETLAKICPVDVYFDTETWYIQDKRQEAGAWFRQYQQHPLLGQHLTSASRSKQPPEIHAIATTTQLEQIHLIAHELGNMLHKHKALPGRTAVVLPDPRLLVPLLDALPNTLPGVQVHIDYPLVHTPLYTLLVHLLRWQELAAKPHQTTNKEAERLRKHVLSHPYMQHSQAEALLQPNTQLSVWSYLAHVVTQLQECLPAATLSSRETTTFAYVVQLCHDLHKVVPEVTQGSKEITRFFQRQALKVGIPFAQQQQAGALHILSIQQTLALDFDYIFLPAMQEGTLPPQLPPPSLIPTTLQPLYGWPSPTQQQAEYAYLFYRLLTRVDKIWLLYHEGKTPKGLAEKSRYIEQLAYETPFTIQSSRLSSAPAVTDKRTITIAKSAATLAKLHRYLEQGTRQALTPSAVNTYLRCPLRFYFKYLAQLPPPEEEVPVIASHHLGTLLHHTMERLYQPWQGQMITAHTVAQLKGQARGVIEQLVQQHHHEIQPGTKQFVSAIIQSLVLAFLSKDEGYAPFKLVATELGSAAPLMRSITLNNGLTIALAGRIDRIDQKGNTVRIIDYKTSTWIQKLSGIETLFDPKTPNPVALQLIWYSWLYAHKQPTQGNLQPVVMTTRAGASQPEPHLLYLADGARHYQPIHDILPHHQAFETHLRTLLQEIFDEAVPFTQTDNLQHCQGCPYNRICH